MKLIAYVSNGYPTARQSQELAATYADLGCDAVQVDLPARDPYLESPLIQDRMEVALSECGDYSLHLQNLAAIVSSLEGRAEVLGVVYVETVKEIGVEEFASFCTRNGLRELTLVGLEDDSVKDRLIAAGLEVSCYVQRTLEPAEVQAALASNGFVYLQAASDQVNPDYPELADCVDYLRGLGIKRPIYCGVGISSPEDFSRVEAAGADGAFVGSAIMKAGTDRSELERVIGGFVSAQA